MAESQIENSKIRKLGKHLLSLAVAILSLASPAQDAGDEAIPELLQPVTLRNADGEAETGLVDPFRRRSELDTASENPDEDGLLRTSMGEISSEFKILAITIPQDDTQRRSALIQFYSSDEPVLVHEGDLVRVDRTARGRNGVQRARAGLARTQRKTQREAELEEELSKYVFYLNVKHIDETYIEVYHNKKRPDETIRLNW